MPNIYIEPRPKGRPEGSDIDDYVVEDHVDHVLATFKTQHEAIKWAKDNGHNPLVALSRHLQPMVSRAALSSTCYSSKATSSARGSP